MTTYITIGNSDNRLTQQEWARFHRHVDDTVREAAASVNSFGYDDWRVTIHGAWVSPSAAPSQNACWAIEGTGALWASIRAVLRQELQFIAHRYGQDTVAWAEAVPEFLPAVDEADPSIDYA